MNVREMDISLALAKPLAKPKSGHPQLFILPFVSFYTIPISPFLVLFLMQVADERTAKRFQPVLTNCFRHGAPLARGSSRKKALFLPLYRVRSLFPPEKEVRGRSAGPFS